MPCLIESAEETVEADYELNLFFTLDMPCEKQLMIRCLVLFFFCLLFSLLFILVNKQMPLRDNPLGGCSIAVAWSTREKFAYIFNHLFAIILFFRLSRERQGGRCVCVCACVCVCVCVCLRLCVCVCFLYFTYFYPISCFFLTIRLLDEPQ